MGGLGPGELIFAFLIVLLLFGAKRLPEIGSSLGKGIREFKGSFTEIERELKAPPNPQIDGPAATPADEETEEDDQD
jgi:sec-independent protein translocase protein TatA